MIVLVLCLICALKGNINMTYATIDSRGEGGTSECGLGVARAGTKCGGGGFVIVARVRDVAPTGVSIRRGGPSDGPAGSDCRAGDGGNVQATAQSGRCRSGACDGGRNDDQRYGEPGAAGVSRRSRRQWLTGAAMIAASISSMPSTVSSPSNWSRSTDYWFQSGFVPSAPSRDFFFNYM